jgi:hypothetical protein
VSDGPAAADHFSLDALAELEEGIATDADERRRHLDHCGACRARAGQLRASRALLSALPPDPMPADVAARIDAALAAEPAPKRGFAPGGDIVPMRARRAWWRGPNLAALAAGVAVLGLGSALIVGHLGGSKSSPSAGADKTSQPVTGAVAAPSTLKQWQTGHNYNAATLPGYVSGLVIFNPPPFTSSAGSQPSPTPAQTATETASPASYSRDSLRDPATVYACAALLAGRPVQPLAIDYASFNNIPAAILVLPGSTPTAQLAVYVIPTACSNSAPDLGFYHVPRPVVRPR